MAGRYYFLLTSLPELPELGETPPVELAELRERLADEPGAAGLTDAMMLDHDLLLREAALAGEIDRPVPVVLTAAQLSGEEPLPPFLSGEPERTFRIPTDAVWEAYYRHVAALAAGRCAFAAGWVGFEVALRNALAAARADALDIDPHEYFVAAELADEDAPVADIITGWAAAPNPLAALQALDRGRWNWTNENSRYFSFQIDELAAYVRKLVLVTRWHALAGAPDADRAGGRGSSPAGVPAAGDRTGGAAPPS